MSRQLTLAGEEFVTPAEKKQRERQAKAMDKTGKEAATALLKAAKKLAQFRNQMTWTGLDVQRALVALAAQNDAKDTGRLKTSGPASRQHDHSCDRCGSVLAEPSDLYEMPADFSCEACLTAAEINNENVS